MKRLLSVEEAARELKVSTHTITRLIREGKLPAEKFGKRAYLIKASHLKLVGKGKRPKVGRPKKSLVKREEEGK